MQEELARIRLVNERVKGTAATEASSSKAAETFKGAFADTR